jgi:hypothetical protein
MQVFSRNLFEKVFEGLFALVIFNYSHKEIFKVFLMLKTLKEYPARFI